MMVVPYVALGSTNFARGRVRERAAGQAVAFELSCMKEEGQAKLLE